MNEDFLTAQFDEHRDRLHAVAYRMLGSGTEADDALQETWLRLSRSDASSIENLGGWLTTVTPRVCLNMLRARRTRREEPLEPHVPDPVVQRAEAVEPEHEASSPTRSGSPCSSCWRRSSPPSGWPSCSMTCSPCRSTRSPRWSTDRRKRPVNWPAVPGAASSRPASPTRTSPRQREVVDAFFAAARGGDFEALVSVLDPDVVRALGRRHCTAARLRGRSRRGSVARPRHRLLAARRDAPSGPRQRRRRSRGRHRRRAVLDPGVHRRRRQDHRHRRARRSRAREGNRPRARSEG